MAADGRIPSPDSPSAAAPSRLFSLRLVRFPSLERVRVVQNSHEQSLTTVAHELACIPIHEAARALADMPPRRAALLLGFMDFPRAADRVLAMPPEKTLAVLPEMDESLACRFIQVFHKNHLPLLLEAADSLWLGRVLKKADFSLTIAILGAIRPKAAAGVLSDLPRQEAAGILEQWSANPFAEIMDEFFGTVGGSTVNPASNVVAILLAMELDDVIELFRHSSFAFAADIAQAIPPTSRAALFAKMSSDELAAMLTSTYTSSRGHRTPRVSAPQAAAMIEALGPRAQPVLGCIHPSWIASLVRTLNPDQAAIVLCALDPDRAEAILYGVSGTWARQTRKALKERARSTRT
ncbi:hypothetical protein ACIBEJ_45860 [Nonomuraea sp. NPDC050790]|uniref:hypothetical protein n=1 Tax=Nonomuraea sp. NPDC050790 TaxID=3364371 RepID=UPI0037B9B611